ncbi:MAG TPA: ABC transporter ATP-binding protein [Solirubrobacteraceae bacterium]|nr:ABC transporter ATP-binding protein [Solirubrobacteraceae bacterium]
MSTQTLLPDGVDPVVLAPARGHRGAPIVQARPSSLVIEGVTKRWRPGQPAVLDDLDLSLPAGSCTAIGGRNGVGKTTLLRIAAGLIDAESGQVSACGVPVHARAGAYQRLVALLPAGDRGLYARLSVRRHLEFWSRVSMIPRARASAAVEEALSQFDLLELRDRRVDRMSMGQRQRLRIAMTFLPEPHVVLLDEPATSLDGDGISSLRAACDRVRERGGAVLWCSPYEDRGREWFDSCRHLRDGRLHEDG